VTKRDPSLNLTEDVEALKLGFNNLCNELNSVKSQPLIIEASISVVKSHLEFIQDSLEIEFATLRTYVKVVSRIESKMVYRRIS
jgi:hypothetical protein